MKNSSLVFTSPNSYLFQHCLNTAAAYHEAVKRLLTSGFHISSQLLQFQFVLNFISLMSGKTTLLLPTMFYG